MATKVAVLISLLVVASVKLAFGSKEDCPVCIGALENIFKSVEDKSDMVSIEKAIDDYCEKVGMNSLVEIDSKSDELLSSENLGIFKQAEGKEVKLCYSISTIKREISKPASMGLPIEKICERVGKLDVTICELRYPKPPTDLTALKEEDIKKMRVKQLKELLQEYHKDCKGCAEKQDFISEVMALRAAKLKSDL